MLTKKAFNREAVLAAYEAIRSGASVPDKELDQVASWLKLSGIVRRKDGLLRVRNAIYEQVFDQRWARVHRRLHVNWRRRLTRAAAALLVLIVLVTIPLAVYAVRQRNVAEGARRQAEEQRDEAARSAADERTQRARAEQQLLTTEQNLQTAQEAVAALKAFDPKAAAQLSSELTTARTTADRQLAALTQERERLRKDRDDAQAQVRKLEQENAALRQQSRPPATASAPTSAGPVVVPNLVDRSTAELARSGVSTALAVDVRVVDSDRPRDTIVIQEPAPGTSVARGTVLRVSVSAGPPPPAPRTTGASATDETVHVLRALQRYRAAYEALDAKAVACRPRSASSRE
jgi:cell division protein FtsB